MYPLLKKNMIYVRQNVVKIIFQFSYPTIFLFIAIWFIRFNFHERLPDIPKYFDQLSYSIFDKPQSLFDATNLYVISKHEVILNEFTSYIQPIFPNSNIVTFETMKEFTESPFIEGFHIIEIDKDLNNELTFKLRSMMLPYESVYFSANLLNIRGNDNFIYDQRNYIWRDWNMVFSKFALSFEKKTQEKDLIINSVSLPYLHNPLAFFSNYTIAILPSLYALICSSYAFVLVLWMVVEKENKLKDLLFRQGISQFTYLLSWFLTYLILVTIPTILSAVCIKYLFYHSNIWLILISQFFFILNIFSMAFFLQAWIDTTKTGQTLLKLLYVGVAVFGYVISRQEISPVIKYIFSIFPQFVQIVNFEILFELDYYEHPFQWSLLNARYNYFTFISTLIWFTADFIIYIGLGLLIVYYKESGVDFVTFMSSLYKKKTRVVLHEEDETINSAEDFTKIHEPITDTILLDAHSAGNMLSIKNVVRQYDDLKAVNNFTGEMYHNQIFCLLGHNGAGKTTLIKMISGLEDPDAGDIFLNNQSLITNKDYLFKSIGLCSQDNIFFDYLTVTEHLELMCNLRGEKADRSEVDDLIKQIDLAEKSHSLCSTLSGGQMRKLCIALALIGNAKLILLDEPTSGMDVITKRFLWKFLKGYKKNKIIILTTHSLDEAEFLGDRIGIMSEGKYICSGTSSFLKNKYSCGYNINFLFSSSVFTPELKQNFINNLKSIDETSTVKMLSKEVLVMNFIRLDSKTSEVFNYIDSVKLSNGINNYTISTTSLEDVFLKLNRNDLNSNMFDEVAPSAKQQGDNLNHTTICSQLSSNITRNLYTLWRNKLTLFLEIIVASITIFFYIFGFDSLLRNSETSLQDLTYLLSVNPIYYVLGKDMNLDYFKDSYLTKVKGKVNFVQLPIEIDINKQAQDIAVDLFLNPSFKINERAILIIKKDNSKQMVVDILYNFASQNYQIVLANIVCSAFFSHEYKININMFDAYSLFPTTDSTRTETSTILFVISNILVWNAFMNLGGYMLQTPLKERLTNIQHVLYLSGMNMFTYWASLLISDMIKYFLFMIIVFPFLIYLYPFFLYVLLIVFFFILSSNIFIYLFSFLFDKEENGQKTYILIVILSAIFFPILYFVRMQKKFNFDVFMSDFDINEMDILPTGTLLLALIKIAVSEQDFLPYKRYIWKIILYEIIIFMIQFVVYGILLCLCQLRVFRAIYHWLITLIFVKKDLVIPLNNNNNQGNNEPQEGLININITSSCQQREIEKINSKRTTVSIWNLSKTFCVCCGTRNVKAINKLFLGLEANEKFGLLGFNGSGKTTTFKAITNEILHESGVIKVFGDDLDKSFNDIRNKIGYCPQENTLFEYMTVLETLKYYKKMQNVTRNEMEICHQFGLDKYLNTFCINLSGGNKRKLTFAIALMRQPQLLLLDEPSTGVDPESRRVMWKNINDLSKYNDEYNMILSTHSMEEAEVLCDTVGWLKEGNFICTGNPEQLKLEMSKGYHLHLKFNVNWKEEQLINANNLIGKHDVQKYDNNEDPSFITHLCKYDQIYQQIVSNCSLIIIEEINSDKSFELLIKIAPDKQGMLFSQLLTLSQEDHEISEISINLQSLEKILTGV